MEKVEVRRCLRADEFEAKAGLENIDEICLRKGAVWRYITIQPVLINDERQRFYIEQILTNPAIERPAEPVEDKMEPEVKRG